jgi:hypothetical protein
LAQNTNANLEPVLRDGLRPSHAGGTFEKTFVASLNRSPAGTWVLREIFSLPRFEKIFDGHFRRDFGRVPGRIGAGRINSKPTLQIFS